MRVHFMKPDVCLRMRRDLADAHGVRAWAILRGVWPIKL